jgi:hypothetical protein
MAYAFYIGIFVYINVIWAKEHSPKVWQIPAETLHVCNMQCDAESTEHHTNIYSYAAPI